MTGGRGRGRNNCTRIASLQHLQTVPIKVAHEHAALAIDGNAESTLDVAGADGAHVLAVTAAEHLNSMVVLVRHNQLPASVECNSQTIIELAITFAFTADAA